MIKEWLHYRSYYLDEAEMDKLILRWNNGFKDFEVIHDKKCVGTFESSKELFEGNAFQLNVEDRVFVKGLPKNNFEIQINNKHLKSSGNHPRAGVQGLVVMFPALMLMNLIHLVMEIAQPSWGFLIFIGTDVLFIIVLGGALLLSIKGYSAGVVGVAILYAAWVIFEVLFLEVDLVFRIIMFSFYGFTIFGCFRFLKNVKRLGKHYRQVAVSEDILDI